MSAGSVEEPARVLICARHLSTVHGGVCQEMWVASNARNKKFQIIEQ